MRLFYLVLLATIVFLPLQFALNPTSSVDLPIIRPLVIVIFLGTIFLMFYKRKTISPSMPLATLSLFLLITLLSLIGHGVDGWGLRKTLFLFSLAPLLIITTFFCTQIPTARDGLTKAIAWSATAIAALGIVQFSVQFIIGLDPALSLWRAVSGFFLGHNLGTAVITHNSWLVHVGGMDLFRLTAFFPDPHIGALYFGMSAPFALWLYLHSKNHFWLFATILIVVADLLTFSRGGSVALLGGAGCFLFFARNTFTSGTKTLLIALVATLVLVFMIPNPVSERFASSFNFAEGSNTQRLHNWRQASDSIKGAPLWGVGIGNYSRAVLPSATYRDPIYAHNLYLDITAELGVFGLIAWLVFIGSIFVAFLSARSLYGIMGATSISIFSIHSIFETALFSIHIFSLLLIIAGLSLHAHNRKDDAPHTT